MRIYTRAEWGARYRDGVGTRPIGNLETYLHHTVTAHLSPNATLAQEFAQMRHIEAIGEQRFKGGMSYGLIIFPSGRIHRATSIHRISYHSGGSRNTRGEGICLAGNYDVNPVGTPVRQSLAWLLNHGVSQGWWRSNRITEGHRDFKSTACPGRYAYPLVKSINASVVAKPPVVTQPKTAWPYVRLLVDGVRGAVTVRAWQRLLAGINLYTGRIDGVWGPMSVMAFQRWLRGLKFYTGLLDGSEGRMTIRALQRFLRPRGHYSGLIDGVRGPMTVRGEQNYLSVQATYFR